MVVPPTFHRVARGLKRNADAVRNLGDGVDASYVDVLGARDAVMAPFAIPNPSRWSDGAFGVLYAAFELPTAVTEHGYHLARHLRESAAGARFLPRIHLAFAVGAALHDVRSEDLRYSDPDDYTFARDRGRELYARREPGVIYRSARRIRGTCAGIFRSEIVRDVTVVARLGYFWDGAKLEAFEQPISPLVF